jgi:phosphoribosylanthranilate isomerase
MKVKVKICGIRSMEHAEHAISVGADFLGFNFVPTSKRVVDPAKAKEIADLIRGKAVLVGVFKDQSVDEVNSIADFMGLDYVQLHGSEDEKFCRQITIPVIKAFGLSPTFDAQETSRHLEKYNIPYYMVDRAEQGEGEMLSLKGAAELAEIYPLFFAGSLTPENVAEVVKHVKPFAVDVAGGIETEGMHDMEKITQFIKNAKEVEIVL